MKESLVTKPIISAIANPSPESSWSKDFPPELEYPKSLKLWETDIPQHKKLQIINEQDFQERRIIEALRISKSSLVPSFGISDEQEIKERLHLMKLLVRSERLRQAILAANVTDIPKTQSSFLEYYCPNQPHNPFWTMVREMCDAFSEAGELSGRVKEFVDKLKEGFCLEEYEMELAKKLNSSIKQIANLDGVLEFVGVLSLQTLPEPEEEDTQTSKGKTKKNKKTVGLNANLKLEQHHAWGHRAFSFAVTEAAKFRYPRLVRSKDSFLMKARVGQMLRWPVDAVNSYKKMRALRSMVIDHLNQDALTDIQRGVNDILTQKLTIHPFIFKEAFPSGIVKVRLKARFTYSQSGLRINIFDITPVETQKVELPISFNSFDGYRRSERQMILDLQGIYTQRLVRHYEVVGQMELAAIIKKSNPIFFSKSHTVESPAFDRQYRWFALPNLFLSPVLSKVHKPLVAYREFVREHLKVLSDVAWLADQLVSRAEFLNVPLCIPELSTEDNHLIQFNEIYPVHLPSDQYKRLRPIMNLPELNGKGLCLTGSHGGGKTATQEAVGYAQYLFQSGLPVPGRGYRANVKDVVGVLFLERGQGSTEELIMKKAVKILKSIQEHESHKILLIMDEIGAGTQEVSGLEFGKEFLGTIFQKDVSAIFNTQILDLARYAEQYFKVNCVYLDESHAVHPGIRDGGMDKLKQRYGFDKLVKKF